MEDMNNVTSQRYDDMRQVASGVADKLSQLNSKCMLSMVCFRKSRGNDML